MKEARVLDVACGSKMFYFDKTNSDVLFCDKRTVDKFEYYPGRFLEVKPDVVCDFKDLPFADESFNLVVFDPPHLINIGEKSFMRTKYGILPDNWQEEIKQGFAECFRVLKTNGTLVFKWSERQIPLKKILPSRALCAGFW